MYYALAAIGGLVVGAAAMWYLARKNAGQGDPQPPPDPQPCPELQSAVETLHQVLFAPYGTIVTPLFNDVWRAAGLEQKGVPDIRGGRT